MPNKYLKKVALSKREADLEDKTIEVPNYPINKILLSSIGGAVAGGLAGSKLGRVAGIAGAVSGASLAGHIATKYLYTDDRRSADKEYQEAAKRKLRAYLDKRS